MESYVTNLTNLPASDYKAALAFLGAGVAISVVLQVLKHFKEKNGTPLSTPVSRALITLFSYVVAAANYILNTPGAGVTTLFRNSAIVLAVSHVVYWVSVSPFYKWFVGLLTDAGNFRAQNGAQPTSVAEEPAGQFAE